MDIRQQFSETERRDFLAFALDAVSAARQTILKRQGSGFSIDLKKDKSFVTEADLDAEKCIRELISKRYPEHSIFGEELPTVNPGADFIWYIDPIDGTRNFANNIPTWGTILGLHYKDEPVVGVIDHPGVNLIYSGAAGLGAYCNGQRLQIRDGGITEGQLDTNEILAISNRGMVERSGEGALFDNFIRCHPNVYIYHDVFASTRAIQGCIGAMVEFNVKMWDLSATRLLVEEAGGKYVTIREIKKEGAPTSYSMVFGKPSVVDFVLPFFNNK